MRKNKAKSGLYENLKTLKIPQNPSNPLQKTTLKLPKLQKKSPSYLRVGCPTEILVHIPANYQDPSPEAKTQTFSSQLLEKSTNFQFFSKPSPKDVKNPSNVLLNEFDSIKISIKSFAEIKLPSHHFNLDSVKRLEDDENLMKVMKKLNNKDMLKPLSPKAEKIKNSFLIKPELLFTPNKSPYFTSPYLFSRSIIMEAEKLIFSYFKGKNYRSSENALKSELKNYLKAEGNAAFLQPVNVPAMTELLKAIHDFNQDSEYFDSFAGFKNWVESTADFYQNDLRKILGPIFIFTYLEMVKREFYEYTDSFYKEFHSCHWDQSELEKLQKIKSSDQDLGVFSQRYPISMDSFSFSQLVYYLETHSLIIILSIINKNLSVNLKSSDTPAVLLGKDLKTQSNKLNLLLDEEKIKKENKIPLPNLTQLNQIRSTELKERKVLTNDSPLSIVCHTIRNANEANCLDVSEDCMWIAAGFDDSAIRVFYLPETGTGIELLGHAGPVFSVSFSPLADFLVSGSDDAYVKLWSLTSYICIANFISHILPVWTVKFAPTGYYFASGGNDKVCYVWNMECVEPVRMLVGHNSDVVCICFHPKVLYVCTGSADKTVRVWDTVTGECLRVFNKHTRSVNAVQFSRDGKTLYSGDELGDICAWDINKKTLIWTIDLISGIKSISLCYDDTLMLIACDTRDLYCVNSLGKVLSGFKSKVEVLFTGFSYRNLGIAAGIVRINSLMI